jgi:Zn-dependent protease with chaperone function
VELGIGSGCRSGGELQADGIGPEHRMQLPADSSGELSTLRKDLRCGNHIYRYRWPPAFRARAIMRRGRAHGKNVQRRIEYLRGFLRLAFQQAGVSVKVRSSGNSGIQRRGRTVEKCVLGLLLFLVSTTPAKLNAQAPAADSSSPTESQTSLQPPRLAETPPQRTDQFRLSQERYQQAVAYSRAGYILHFISTAWRILVLLVLLGYRVVAKLREAAVKTSGNIVGQAIIFVASLTLLTGALGLPLRIYWHRLSLRYQQSVEGWGSWFWDWTKSELIVVVLGTIVALILFVVIRWKPRRWWLYFWFASILLLPALIVISPWLLDPMFNKFTPLSDKHADLVQGMEQLAKKAGIAIPQHRMFLMQASAKSNQINAYVTGLGASKRVVVWDNTIEKMAPEEVLFVVGHEMGHYALGHVLQGIAFGLLGMLVALYIAYRALEWLLAHSGRRWGVASQQDWAALAVLLLIFQAIGFLAEPVANGFSRMQEHAADVYGLEVIHGIIPNSNQTAAHAFQVMGESDLADPSPSRFITVWLFSHPPLADRLEFAQNYHPWGPRQSPKYVK